MPTSKIHNIGFYKLAPNSISCMSYEPTTQKLAVCRSDTTIEIWNILYAPFIEKTISTRETEDLTGETIEGIKWSEFRLFYIKIRGTITECDLTTLKSKYELQVTSGAAWCLDINQSKTQIAVGTEVGYINIFTITENGIDFEKLLDKQEGRIMCIKYNANGQHLVTGSVDTVRIWNVKTGHAIHKMVTGRAQNNQETIVWCLAVTDDFTIISGDSRGRITFWDGNMGTYVESYLSHRADVLSICLSDDQKTIYCAGVDPVIMSFAQVQLKANHLKWVKSIQRNIHDHDVRSLILVENKLYSGGVDGYLAMSTYPPKTLIKYPPLLQNPVVSICAEKRMILLRYSTYLEIWKLAVPEQNRKKDYTGILRIKERPEKLLKIKSKNDQAILCSAISKDGTWLAYSTSNELRIFNVTIVENEDLLEKYCKIELSRIDQLPQECLPGFQIMFSQCSKKVILASLNGGLQIIGLSHTLNRASLIQTISLIKEFEGLVNNLILSYCGKYLIASDTVGAVAIWFDNIKKEDSSWKTYAILPKYHCPATALSIQGDTNLLVVAYADHKIIEYNVQRRIFTEFSSLLTNTKLWMTRALPIIGVAHDPRAKNAIILYDDTSIYIIDKAKDLPEENSKIPRIESPVGDTANHDLSKKRHGFCIIKKYKHLVYFGYVQEDELIAIEVNPITLIEQLPPCLKTKKFGLM